MRIVTFSDTHNCHDKVNLPECDIAIFAGDYSGRGNKLETYFFFRWFSNQTQCKHKIAIVGNHDICFDDKHIIETQSDRWLQDCLNKYNNIILLNNTSINIEGINIWGSPITIAYRGDRWAFNSEKSDIGEYWDLIPDNTDILITHGPAFGILDKTLKGNHSGCIQLLDKIEEIKPKYHIFGHIHESYGVYSNENTVFINCALMDDEYYISNKPIQFIF